jgi:TetR/AcrR family fatty acid metabolism transcriptional regulator
MYTTTRSSPTGAWQALAVGRDYQTALDFARTLSLSLKVLTYSIYLCYILVMRTKYKTGEQNQPSFIEVARRVQIIECAIQTIAELGYGQASLAQIAQRAGISKGVITYYFSSKEELIEQVFAEIYAAGAQFMGPRIAAQPTATLMLQTYIQTNVEYIGAHRTQMLAIIEIVLNFRQKDGRLHYNIAEEEPVLTALETLLRKGQQDGEFRTFDPRVIAVTIRRAIDAIPPLLAANPGLDVEAYAQELVILFDRATCKE